MKSIEETRAESDAQIVAEFQGRKWTRKELQELFERVENPDHWKAPINTAIECTDEEAVAIAKAVEFFTASTCSWKRIPTRGQVHFEAVGYWEACGE